MDEVRLNQYYSSSLEFFVSLFVRWDVIEIFSNYGYCPCSNVRFEVIVLSWTLSDVVIVVKS
jgi:hypothetical protein